MSPKDKKKKSAEPRDSVQSIVTKLVFIPLLIVAMAVGLFLFFGWLTYDRRAPEEFLADVKTGNPAKKWQSAFVLAGKLRDKENIDDPDQLYRELVAILEDPEKYDAQVRSYVAMALGNLGHLGARTALEKAAANPENEDVRIYALWALGTLRSPESFPVVLEAARADDPAIKKVGLFVLGLFQNDAAIPVLKEALKDEAVDIRWNATFALAKLGDRSSLPLIERLLDREYYTQFSEMDTTERNNAVLNALRSVALLKERSLLPIVESISRNDINMQVRQAAHEVLHILREPS